MFDRRKIIFQTHLDYLLHIYYGLVNLIVKQKHIGRPRLGNGKVKSEAIRVRITPAEKAALEKIAKGRGKVSAWARKKLFGK